MKKDKINYSSFEQKLVQALTLGAGYFIIGFLFPSSDTPFPKQPLSISQSFSTIYLVGLDHLP